MSLTTRIAGERGRGGVVVGTGGEDDILYKHKEGGWLGWRERGKSKMVRRITSHEYKVNVY